MDVKVTFLRGDLQEKTYMEPPPGFIQDFSFVLALKQAPGAWYETMDSFLL